MCSVLTVWLIGKYRHAPDDVGLFLCECCAVLVCTPALPPIMLLKSFSKMFVGDAFSFLVVSDIVSGLRLLVSRTPNKASGAGSISLRVLA